MPRMLHVFAVLAMLLATPPAAAAAAPVSGIGTVLQLGPTTRVWLIRADDGASYEVLNLAPAFRRDGLRVHFRARLVPRHRPLTAGARTIRIVRIANLADDASPTQPTASGRNLPLRAMRTAHPFSRTVRMESGMHKLSITAQSQNPFHPVATQGPQSASNMTRSNEM